MGPVEFNTYSVKIMAGNTYEFMDDVVILITLYKDNKTVALLHFSKKEERIGQMFQDGNIVTLYYHTDLYIHIIDLLRNESPLRIVTGEHGARQLAYISTGNEAIGEAEIQAVTSTNRG